MIYKHLAVTTFALLTSFLGGVSAQLCNICGGNNILGENNNAVIRFLDQFNVTQRYRCQRLQDALINGNLPTTQEYCNYILPLTATTCNCTGSDPVFTEPTTDDSTGGNVNDDAVDNAAQNDQTDPPTLFCNICGPENVIGNQGATIDIIDGTGTTQSLTCNFLQESVKLESSNALFPNTVEYCDYIFSVAAGPCECFTPDGDLVVASDQPSDQPTMVSTTMTPSFAPTTSPTAMPSTIPPTTAPTTAAPSEAPSTEEPATEIPASEVPATVVPTTEVPASEVPASEVPATEVPATEVPETPVVLLSCSGQCQIFSDVAEISEFVAQFDTSGRVCLCPQEYSPQFGGCPDDPAASQITITDGQDITIECAGASSEDLCIFGCPQILAYVQSGGVMNMIGVNGSLQATGGLTYSRIVVETEASVNITGMTFFETAATSTQPSRRHLIEGAPGSGGAIESAGTLNIFSSTFQTCTALDNGGAISAAFGTNTNIYNSSFINNAALGEGGAIYSEGSLYLEGTKFENNKANTADPNVGGGPVLRGCGNEGLPELPACVEGVQPVARSSSRLISHAVGLLIPIAFLVLSTA